MTLLAQASGSMKVPSPTIPAAEAVKICLTKRLITVYLTNLRKARSEELSNHEIPSGDFQGGGKTENSGRFLWGMG